MIALTSSATSDALVAFSLNGCELPSALPSEARERTPTPSSSERLQPVPSDRNTADPCPKVIEKSLLQRVCTKCHGVSGFTNLRMDRTAWGNEVASIVEKGATGTDQEIRTVVDYLAANFR